MAAAILFAVVFRQPETQELDTPTSPAITSGEWIETGDDSRCLDRSDAARVCLAPSTKARSFTTVEGREGYELAHGTIGVDLPPRAPRRPFAIMTPAGEVEAVGTVFAVQVSRDGETVAQLLEGRLRIHAAGVDAVAISAGETIVVGTAQPGRLGPSEAAPLRALLGLPEPAEASETDELSTGDEQPPTITTGPVATSSRQPSTTTAAQPTPSSLLQKARRLRLEGRHSEAAAAYRELQQRHPSSAEARAALVSLGQLQLSHLSAPSAALRSFDAYLSREGGALDREALHGRIRALRALGRAGAERRAIEGYLRRFPSGVRANSLRLRLQELQD
jgi:hypothetical protein